MAKTSILLKMGLDTSKVKASLEKTKKNIGAFSSNAISKLGGVAKIAAGSLVAGFVASAKAAMDYGRELKNLSKVSGASFDEFQRMTLGARSVGVENEKLADIFKDVNDKLGDFAQAGSGPMKDFFEFIGPAVGVTIKDFQKLSGPEALQLYYDSLEQVNLNQQDMTFYMEAIASDAALLMPLLKDGGKAWEEYSKKMEEAGLMMDEEMVAKLEKANLKLEILRGKTRIATVDMLEAYTVFGAGFGQVIREMDNVVMGLENVLRGTFTFDEKQLQSGWAMVFNSFKEGGKRITEIMNEEAGISDVVTEVAELPKMTEALVAGLKSQGIEAIQVLSVAETEAIKNNRKIRLEVESKISEVRKKIAAERDKQAQAEMTATEAYAAAIQKRTGLETELMGLKDAHAKDTEGFLGLEKVILDKTLEVEKAITDEGAKQIKHDDDQVKKAEEELDKKREKLNLEILLAEAAGDTVKARDLQAQLDQMDQIKAVVDATGVSEDEAYVIVTKKNAAIEEQNVLQRKLAEAQAVGNSSLAASIEREIAKRAEVKKLVETTNLSEKEAGQIIDERNAKIDRQKALRLQVIQAEANGNDALAKELQGRIDKEQEAIDLMEEFNLTLAEATALAGKLAAMRAGPDLNNSGIVTKQEQKEFDRREKVKAKELEKARRAEEREQRDRGGNIRNVSDEKRNVGTVRERAAEAKEKRMRNAENQKINRERDPEKRKALIEAADKRRADVEAKKAKPGGQPPNADDAKQLDKDGNVIDKNGNPLDENGNPQEPKKPENPVVDALGKKLDEQTALLTAIEKSLKC